MKAIEFHVHLHTHADPAVLAKLDLIHEQGTKIMAKLEAFQQALSDIDAETTRIGDYIAGLIEQLKRDDLTDAEEQVVLGGLTAAGERLKGVGKSVEAAVPGGDLPTVPGVNG